MLKISCSMSNWLDNARDPVFGGKATPKHINKATKTCKKSLILDITSLDHYALHVLR